MKRHINVAALVISALLAFWFYDSPATVRLKMAVLKLLPLQPDNLNDSIVLLCAGAYSGSAIDQCFGNFHSASAARIIEERSQCADITRFVATNKNWKRSTSEDGDPKLKTSYIYVGNNDQVWKHTGILMFYPDACLTAGLKNGQATSYNSDFILFARHQLE